MTWNKKNINDTLVKKNMRDTFMNDIKLRSMIPSPLKICGRCAFAMIIRTYFCKFKGNLYHVDSNETSA